MSAFFTKEYTNFLKGLSALVVILVHVPEKFQNPVQDMMGSFAYVCVTFFFMVSAYGMMKAAPSPSYLKHFWRNRLSSLLVPLLMINLLSVLLSMVFGLDTGWRMLLAMNPYVSVLLQWCLAFYLVKRFRLPDLVLVAVVVLSSLVSYFFGGADAQGWRVQIFGWPFERLGLVWGIFLYKYFDGLTAFMNKYRVGRTLAFLGMSICLGVMYLKYKNYGFWGGYLLKIVLGLSILSSLFILTCKWKIWSFKPGQMLGDISYEVYLSHGFVMSLLAMLLPGINSHLFILLSILVTIMLSIVAHFPDKHLVKLLRK